MTCRMTPLHAAPHRPTRHQHRRSATTVRARFGTYSGRSFPGHARDFTAWRISHRTWRSASCVQADLASPLLSAHVCGEPRGCWLSAASADAEYWDDGIAIAARYRKANLCRSGAIKGFKLIKEFEELYDLDKEPFAGASKVPIFRCTPDPPCGIVVWLIWVAGLVTRRWLQCQHQRLALQPATGL